MNITENIEVTLKEKDLQELIEKELLSKGYVIDGKIHIDIGTEWQGYGQSEHKATVFRGITAKAKKLNDEE